MEDSTQKKNHSQTAHRSTVIPQTIRNRNKARSFHDWCRRISKFKI